MAGSARPGTGQFVAGLCAAFAEPSCGLNYDAIIIGGGAAGLFCARVAALRGRRVLVLEHQARLGNKILISGGGRCNFTNLGASAANYVTRGSPHFLMSALARWTPEDFLTLVERHGIAWHERNHRQLFCNQSSKQLLRLLEDECAGAGVEVRLNCRLLRGEEGRTWQVERLAAGTAPAGSRFRLATTAGAFTTHSLVVATGGLSFPQLGATPLGHELAAQLGVKLVPVRPGLVPLTWSPADREQFAGLSGIAFECVASVRTGGPSFREAVLFTHRGLSGPAILQVSNYWRAGEPVCLDLLPDCPAADLFAANRTGGRDVKAALRQVLPERFVRAWCSRHAPAKPIAQLTRAELEGLARQLHAWEITPAGDEGYAKAEVTVGGVDTGELSSKTLECREVPGLFFVGEVVDVTGWLGGYNFQWAWASGHAAGQAV
jgi:predicted Rossmann fold flavoprotein